MTESATKVVPGEFPELFQRQNILIIEGRYYDDIGNALLAGAVAELNAMGAGHTHMVVPGALEIPQVLAQVIERDLVGADANEPVYTGVIAIGCVIRGETYHFEIVCNEANRTLMELAVAHAIPLGNAILTVNDHEQALARAVGGREGKGGEAARACLKLIEVAARLDGEIA